MRWKFLLLFVFNLLSRGPHIRGSPFPSFKIFKDKDLYLMKDIWTYTGKTQDVLELAE